MEQDNVTPEGITEFFNSIVNMVDCSPNKLAHIKTCLRLGLGIAKKLESIIVDFNNALHKDSNSHLKSMTSFIDFMKISW